MSLDNAKHLNLDGRECSFAVVASRFNGEMVEALLSDVLAVLKKSGVNQDDIRVVRVPGASEIPTIAGVLASTFNYDVIITLGVVIAGETPHHEIIGNSTAVALQRVALDTGVPVINGIIVANTKAQAEARTTGKIRRGIEFAQGALDMAHVSDEVLQEYMLATAASEDDGEEIEDGFFGDDDDDVDEFGSQNFDDDFSDDFDDVESGGVVELPEDNIFDGSAPKKRAVKKNRKPRKN